MATAQDLINQGYYGYRGWNDAAASADFNATHGAGKGGPTSNPQNNQTGGNTNFNDVANTAQQLNQGIINANQPGIQTLQSGSADLSSRYNDLLNSIKGAGSINQQQGSVMVNQQTRTTNNELGARGILPTSGLYQQSLTDALQPVYAQNAAAQNANAQLQAQTGVSEGGNLMQIAQQIAALQGGNPEAALTGATSIFNTQGNLALGSAQLAQTAAYNALMGRIAQQNANTSASGVGVEGMNANTNAGQLALAGSTFNAQYNPNVMGSYLSQIKSFQNQGQNSTNSGGINGWNPNSFITP